jgi:hypothetical protein
MTSTLNVILELTDRVQNAIDSGDWQAAHDLELERRSRLEQLVASSQDHADLGTAFATLEQRNRRLIGLVAHHRRRVLREAATVKTGHSAVSAYAAAETS